MSHTHEQQTVPFTRKSFLGILLYLGFLTAPIWWPRSKVVVTAKKPDLTGEWVGSVHITQYVQGVGRSRPMNQTGICYFKLTMYDHFVEEYRGDGEMAIGGDHSRTLHISALSLDDWAGEKERRAAAGAARVSGTLSGMLELPETSDDVRSIEGSASPVHLRFKTADDSPGFQLEIDLQRGTLGAYEAQVKARSPAH